MFGSIKKLRPRSGYDVLSVIATCAALGTGGAYAAATIGGADVIDQSLTGQDVADKSLKGDDIDEWSLDEVAISGVKTYYDASEMNSDSPKSAKVRCPIDKKLLGTGYEVVGGISGTAPNTTSNITVHKVHTSNSWLQPGSTNIWNQPSYVQITAVEDEPQSTPWQLKAEGICGHAFAYEKTGYEGTW